jgi:hypothetical protein
MTQRGRRPDPGNQLAHRAVLQDADVIDAARTRHHPGDQAGIHPHRPPGRDGSLSNSHRPSSEGTFRPDTPRTDPYLRGRSRLKAGAKISWARRPRITRATSGSDVDPEPAALFVGVLTDTSR